MPSGSTQPFLARRIRRRIAHNKAIAEAKRQLLSGKTRTAVSLNVGLSYDTVVYIAKGLTQHRIAPICLSGRAVVSKTMDAGSNPVGSATTMR